MINEIKIGSPIKKIYPKNKYRLHTSVMHGDADLYETHTVDLDKDGAILYWNLFSAYFEYGFNHKYVPEDDIRIVLDQRCKELGIDGDSWDYCYDIIGTDVTTDAQYLARLEKMWLTYFDEQGVEHWIEDPRSLGLGL